MAETSSYNPEKIKEAFANLTDEQKVLNDRLIELGIVKEDDAKHFEFLNSLDSKQVDFFIQSVDQEVWKKINYEKAKELGLEFNLIPGNEAAGRLIQELKKEIIDFIPTYQGNKTFVYEWVKECPNIPIPCVPENNDFWYLKQVSQDRIVSNIQGEPIPAIPNFQENEILFIDNWQEEDWGDRFNKTPKDFQLLTELCGDITAVFNIERNHIDRALWDGDPADRIPTKKHKEILKQLGCDPKEFEIRLIRQDEYARLAPAKGWGQEQLYTHFDNYSLEDNGDRAGLCGGYKELGGALNVTSDVRRIGAHKGSAVRLVVARKQK